MVYSYVIAMWRRCVVVPPTDRNELCICALDRRPCTLCELIFTLGGSFTDSSPPGLFILARNGYIRRSHWMRRYIRRVDLAEG